MGNMYPEAIFRWNCFVGCNFYCDYCKKSFRTQMRRQIHNCEKCGNYIPHFHEDRITKEYIKKKLPKKTEGDQFIWVGSSGDISFIQPKYMPRILEIIQEKQECTFFFQTKNPKWYAQWEFPDNVILGITLETNCYTVAQTYSDAPSPRTRFTDFMEVTHSRKCITIEPILDFYLFTMVDWCVKLNPERIYIGYDSKQCYLDEPTLDQTLMLIDELKLNLPNCKVIEKLIRSAWDEKL